MIPRSAISSIASAPDVSGDGQVRDVEPVTLGLSKIDGRWLITHVHFVVRSTWTADQGGGRSLTRRSAAPVEPRRHGIRSRFRRGFLQRLHAVEDAL